MAGPSRQRPPSPATAYLFHHVALPPKLPQASDHDAAFEKYLIDIALEALRDLKASTTTQHKYTVNIAIATVTNLREAHDSLGQVSEAQLRPLLSRLLDGTCTGSIPLEIKAQNSGILISRKDNYITFECFELSPTNNNAMLNGRLLRSFPGLAARIAIPKLQEPGLVHMLSETLAKMSTQVAPGFQPQVRKAGQNHDEVRDTTHPGMVTDYLLNVITSLGEKTDVACITKHTREEILWDNALQPWRRSPMWLLIRVVLQLHFARSQSTLSIGDSLYKAFGIQMLVRILGSARSHWSSFGNDHLHVLNAKILRRVRKLEMLSKFQCLKASWICDIRSLLVDTFTFMDKKWRTLTDDTSTNLSISTIESLRPETSLDMHLPGLDKFILDVRSRQSTQACAEFDPVLPYPTFASETLPKKFSASGDYRHFQLAALESWVENYLQEWIENHQNDNDTCTELLILIRAYHSCAVSAYSDLPVSLSVMYLTVLELWVACDRAACDDVPLLSTYSPEIELAELQCLVLPLRTQMKRLDIVEKYVRSRNVAAINKVSLYRDFGKAQSFAVKYFDQTSRLQDLRSKIEEDADTKRKHKCEELAQLKTRYESLMSRYSAGKCEYVTVVTNHHHNYTTTVHNGSCSRCSLKQEAESLNISIYEWPLSPQNLSAKATVFELAIPETFSAWRDASAYIIHDLLGFKAESMQKPRNSYRLDNHRDLSHMLDRSHHSRRIIPLSSVKPHSGTHRNLKTAVSTLKDEDVCLPNALQYLYYDTCQAIWTSPQISSGQVHQKCMHRMPGRSRGLERFLSKPTSSPDGLTPNEVVASQSDCPPHFSIEEYKAFGALPLGRNIFYSNILTQLAAPTLDFSKVETQCLILQTVTQVGVPDGRVERASHHVLTDPAFGTTMMEHLETALQRTAENWESWRAVATLVRLACRILSLTPASDVRQRSLDFLSGARQVAVKWHHRLKSRAAASTDDSQRTELFARAAEIALLGTSTFDVEYEFLRTVLQQQGAVSSLLQCSISVQENLHLILGSENLQDCALQAWRSLMYRMFPELLRTIMHDCSGLNEAVSTSWASFQSTEATPWKSLNKPKHHWLYIFSGKLPVHVNLLTGELLVNGLPLTRLPSEYLVHPMYTPLFSASALEVVPTDEVGMRFSAKTTYHGHELHFGMANGDMLVVAICVEKKLDLTPAQVFEGRLPHAFVAHYIHWYDHRTSTVIFRPRENPWHSSSADEWHLRRHGSHWRLSKGPHTLVNVCSSNARTLSALLKLVEDELHIHIIHDTSSRSTEIQLPRLQLDFQVTDGDDQIRSRQYRGMIVDEDQRVGTLVGLTSKIVLRNTMSTNDRLVLIPEGPVRFSKTRDHHVSVTIGRQDDTKVHAYQVDTTLGRILDNGALQSKLMLCYLHALTSHCLRDPLTGNTGTEAALKILRSSAVRSFDILTLDNIRLLKKIAVLSPSRSFYPANEHVMQQIEWKTDLSCLSQHGDFHFLVKEILKHEEKMSLFRSSNLLAGLDPDELAWMSSVNFGLHQRASARDSVFRVSGFGAELFTTKMDSTYQARDRPLNSDRGQRAFTVAKMTVREPATLDSSVPNLATIRQHFRRTRAYGAKDKDSTLALCYDSKWLDDPSTIMEGLWCTLHHNLASSRASYNKFDIMIWLSAMAFASEVDMNIIRALLAFYRMPELATVQVPRTTCFELTQGNTFKLQEIRAAAQKAARSYKGSQEAKMPKQGSETKDQHLHRIENLFRVRSRAAIDNFVNNLQEQWPCEDPSTPSGGSINTFIDCGVGMDVVRRAFKLWYDNRSFERYMDATSDIIQRFQALRIVVPRFIVMSTLPKISAQEVDRHCNSIAIFGNSPPTVSTYQSDGNPDTLITPSQPSLPLSQSKSVSIVSETRARVDDFCSTLNSCVRSACEQRYVDDLRSSCDSFHEQERVKKADDCLINDHAQTLLRAHLIACEDYVEKFNIRLTEVLELGIFQSTALASQIGMSPRTSPMFWLSLLNRDRYDRLPKRWQAAIIQYGLAITNLHRAQRLVALCDKPVELNEELRHRGNVNWNPADYPETLLLEAESGIMVREVQAQIAEHMMHPEGNHNTVMQLNMGEGKSSTIVPIVAASLADRERLVRVIVAKPQSSQMLQMLIAKLGGLIDRQIYHMPFSRDLRLDENDARAIRTMYEDCMANRGILLIQPEHILSFKLMGIESLLTEKPATARLLLDTVQWFDQVSRDIVDESDENFSVKFELIYTMGSQRAIGFAPDRWLLIQEVLGLIPRLATQVQATLPLSIEAQDGSDGRFPRVRILRDDGAEALLALLTEHIIKTGLTGLPICGQPRRVQESVMDYISMADLTLEQVHAVEQSRFWTSATKEPLLLIRGLLAGGVLRFALTQKRWRVNYGLDSTRVPHIQLAVPYKAKDSPSPRSEFSHPDVVILLTLLSYYYGGLKDQELFDSFAHLLKSDHSNIHYNEWVRTAAPGLPVAFRQLSGVSIKDRVMCIQQIFPHLRYARAAINYYLRFLVFPKAMKEFPSKLSASGWDLGAKKEHPTTGFSGTNDTMHVLPLAVKHLDLLSQSHTNALVLSYILQPETSVEQLSPRSNGTDAEHLLTVINGLQPEVRVVLDVGALILEMDNTQVAQCWLSMRRDDRTEAVVFFKGEELTVLDVSGRIDSFQTSPFAKQLDRCLVYLDEAHTRGTDLKLPRDYRAAVTLGANLTKDRLVQACMRLRKLGKGQSVVFMAPQEICMKIRERRQAKVDTAVTVTDVLCWSIGETWLDLSRSMPLWAVQGHRYKTHKHLLNGATTTLAQAEAFLEDEAQSIEDRYKPILRSTSQFSGWDATNPSIKQIQSRCREFEAMGFNSATLQEEQERELSPEIEEERQIERPLRMTAEKHTIHPDLVQLSHTGQLPRSSPAFQPAFQALNSTCAARDFDLVQFPKDLLVTADFIRTVQIPAGSKQADFVSDSYLRPVQWILSVTNATHPDTIQQLIILSPFEANSLRSTIEEHKKVTLHLFAPRFNVSLAPLDELKLFNVGRNFDGSRVPQSLTVQLNIFAGSLYLRSFAEYQAVCDFLGLLRGTLGPDQQAYADGFIDPPSGGWGLRTSPVQFLRALLMKIRKEGEGVEKTHMGRLLGGVRLEESDFDTGAPPSQGGAGSGAPGHSLLR
ncbi:uncharacterized protein M421DRAFT_57599 [Didymella exigua CBS 183.55]|uniref:ubiquitinyl hydrolase 1 n=1 Tax=Didymella exigua CBS 183.55 TaxID=1150837 RepID=A0A6A5S0A7_9PLEO|nr:uncharacterized protein M421DRAFT_57599 [Didymella exigua CBS 183.55]KAF1930947.1 hypothetical protein M421DRAFT_57599 [Didymella exigua CBS 183.55]